MHDLFSFLLIFVYVSSFSIRYAGCRLLEKYADLKVFPYIDVESKMENKESYLRHLLMQRNSTSQVRATPYDGLRHQLVDRSIRQCQHSLKHDDDDIDASGKQIWRQTVPFDFHPHNPHLAPTIIFNWHHVCALITQRSDQLAYLRHLMIVVEREARIRHWQVLPEEWIIKGCNSTRTNVMKRCKTKEELLAVIEKATTKGFKMVRIK